MLEYDSMSIVRDWKNKHIIYLGEEEEHKKIRVHIENAFKT